MEVAVIRKKALILDNSVISIGPCMCSFFCNFTFQLAKNFQKPNTDIEMKLNGVMMKKNEGFPELSRNRLK